MAKKSNKSNQIEYQGPSQSGNEGYGPGRTPPNPSDAIFSGAPLPIVAPQATVLTRSFREPIRPPLHHWDGPGPDEAVTSRRPPAVPRLGPGTSDMDHEEINPIQGSNKQPYSNGSNIEKTLNGAEIYGT